MHTPERVSDPPPSPSSGFVVDCSRTCCRFPRNSMEKLQQHLVFLMLSYSFIKSGEKF